MSNSSSLNSVPKYSLNSSMRVCASHRELALAFLADVRDRPRRRTRRRCRRRSARARPRSSPGPATPPYSSTTIAMWLRLARNSLSSTLRRLLSGTNTAGRMHFLDVEVARGRLRRSSAAGPSRAGCRRPGRGPRPITGKREWPRLDHGRQDVRRRIVAVDDRHLRARHHDVAHLQLGDAQHAFEHRERVGVDQAALARLRAASRSDSSMIARLAAQRVGDPPQPAAGRTLRLQP